MEQRKKPVPTNVAARLKALLQDVYALVDKASESQQMALFTALQAWRHNRQRKYSRKPVILPVDYAIDDRAFQGMITNIGAGGVFIEAPKGAAIGQSITLTFSLPHSEKPFKTTGKIAWKDANSFGVRFITTPYLEEHLKRLVQSI